MIADVFLDDVTFVGVEGNDKEDIKNKIAKTHGYSNYGKTKMKVIVRSNIDEKMESIHEIVQDTIKDCKKTGRFLKAMNIALITFYSIIIISVLILLFKII